MSLGILSLRPRTRRRNSTAVARLTDQRGLRSLRKCRRSAENYSRYPPRKRAGRSEGGGPLEDRPCDSRPVCCPKLPLPSPSSTETPLPIVARSALPSLLKSPTRTPTAERLWVTAGAQTEPDQATGRSVTHSVSLSPPPPCCVRATSHSVSLHRTHRGDEVRMVPPNTPISPQTRQWSGPR